jgi:hypothetical protein
MRTSVGRRYAPCCYSSTRGIPGSNRIWTPRVGCGRSAVAWEIVGTKVDKLTRTERARHGRELETLFDLPVALVSARTGEGLDDLWKMIASLPRTTAA